MFNRLLSQQIQRLVQQYPIVAVTGPRQSGKTTLLQQQFADFRYVSLEDPDKRSYAENDPKGFLANYSQQVIFDEVQRVPQLFSYLQSHVDAVSKPGQFILSGSQNFLLLEQITQSLAGRVALLNLLPLSMREMVDAQLMPNSLEELLFTGFYPRIYQQHLNPLEWHLNYIRTYLERDVRSMKNISDLSMFQRFLEMCASRCGQLLNLSALASDCGITHNTAKSWISVLEASFIVFLLRPYHANLGKRLVKTPKLYFYDTGLVCGLLGIEQALQLNSHFIRGGLFESFVVTELIKNRYNKAQVPRLYFWRDKTGHEVDCLIDSAGSLTPVEIKSGKTIVENFFDGIEYFRDHSNNVAANSFIIYGGDEEQKRSKGHVIPWRNIDILNDLSQLIVS